MVARRSPQTERIIALINFLTVDESGNGVLLSELARRLGVSMATCYPMLEALTEAGFLVRHPTRKTFHLGPAIIAAGHAAARQDPRRALAHEAMVRLGEKLDITAWLYGMEETHFRIIDQVWRSRAITPIMRVGERFRSRPPVGAALMAWLPEHRIERWLDQGQVAAEDRAAYHDRLAEVRAAGYAVSLEEMPIERLRGLVTRLTKAATPAERGALVEMLVSEPTLGAEVILADPAPGRQYSVMSIDAPIFDNSGRPAFAVGLINLPPMRGDRIAELARHVKDAAAEVNDL